MVIKYFMLGCLLGLFLYACENSENHPNLVPSGTGASLAGQTGAMTAGQTAAFPAGQTAAFPAGQTGAMTAGQTAAFPAGQTGAMTAGQTGAMTAGQTGAMTAGQAGGMVQDRCNPLLESQCDVTTMRPCTPRAGSNGATLIQGTLVTPDQVICDGNILIDKLSAKIICVGQCEQEPLAAQASVICGDLILPGMIDAHNHMSYNTLPKFIHEGPTYLNRGQWNGPVGDALYDAKPETNDPVSARYNEFRLLLSGTTSVHKSDSATASFDHVRNLDRSYNGNQLGYGTDDFKECVFPLDNCNSAINYSTNDVPSRIYVAHVAEGYDEKSRREFDDFDAQGQLGEKTSIIHCVACTGTQLNKMRALGSRLIWSPQSNIDLYGVTTDIPTALNLGIITALAPDWTPSGTMNLFAELKCAQQVSQNHYQGRISDQELVRMVTDHAAYTMGVDDLIGKLRVGYYADILVLSGNRSLPYQSIVSAKQQAIRAVFINGNLYYGDNDVFDPSIAHNQFCEPLNLCGLNKTICIKSVEGVGNRSNKDDWAKFNLQEHIDYLNQLIASKPRTGADYAYQLYPLFECEPTYDCQLGNATYPGQPSSNDNDGDQFTNDQDNCPNVFNITQGDLDNDGQGDACDVCPWAYPNCPCPAPAGSDQDGDTIADQMDNCVRQSNVDQRDSDADGVGDLCDACPNENHPTENGCATAILLGNNLVINEIDYDQVEDRDPAEFVEIYNPTQQPIDLVGIKLELVNGNNDATYDSYELSLAGTSLAPGAFLLLHSPGVIPPAGVMTISIPANSIQNGSPDGLRLVANGQVLDSMSYEGSMANVTEGIGLANQAATADQGEGSLGRCPDGVDSQNNADDFKKISVITPGSANPCTAQ